MAKPARADTGVVAAARANEVKRAPKTSHFANIFVANAT